MLFILTNIIFTNIYCQSENLILGTWIKADLKSNNKEINQFTDYLKYTFRPNNKFYLSTDRKSLGFESDYKIDGKTLQLSFNKQAILKLDKDSLIIQDSNKKGEITTIYFIRKEMYLKNSINQNDYLLKDKNTVYFESELIFPTFKNRNYKSAHEFITHKVKGNSSDREEFSFATFIIDTTGQVSEIKIFHHINKKYDLNVIDAIKKTDGMWVLPIINGKKVPILKMWEILYYKMPNGNELGGRNSNVVMYMSKPEKFNKRYTLFFSEGVKQYLKKNYKSALNFFKRCKNLTSYKLNSVIQIANCYKELGENDEYNKIKKTIENSKLDYTIEN
jgi:hypothetical protein